LLSFEVKSNSVSGKNSADLKWTTTQEINTKEFIIERRTNNKDFEAIGVKAAINKSGINYYSFSDDNPAAGNSYYRLKQVDINGNFTYSNLAILHNALENLISFYPNPVKDEMTITYDAEKPATIHITSMDGKKLHTQSITGGTKISL